MNKYFFEFFEFFFFMNKIFKIINLLHSLFFLSVFIILISYIASFYLVKLRKNQFLRKFKHAEYEMLQKVEENLFKNMKLNPYCVFVTSKDSTFCEFTTKYVKSFNFVSKYDYDFLIIQDSKPKKFTLVSEKNILNVLKKTKFYSYIIFDDTYFHIISENDEDFIMRKLYVLQNNNPLEEKRNFWLLHEKIHNFYKIINEEMSKKNNTLLNTLKTKNYVHIYENDNIITLKITPFDDNFSFKQTFFKEGSKNEGFDFYEKIKNISKLSFNKKTKRDVCEYFISNVTNLFFDELLIKKDVEIDFSININFFDFIFPDFTEINKSISINEFNKKIFLTLGLDLSKILENKLESSKYFDIQKIEKVVEIFGNEIFFTEI